MVNELVTGSHPLVCDKQPHCEIEEKVGASAGPCGFCGKPVSKDEMYMMTIYDAANKRGYSRGFWFHLPCFNARVHHKFAVANMKFDPNNLPDLDKL